MENIIYENNTNGKKELVSNLIKPLLLNADMGWENVEYNYDRLSDTENVVLTNMNPSKSISVNVTADSKRALIEDLARAIFRSAF